MTYTQYRVNGASSVLDLTFATQAITELVTNWTICNDLATKNDHEIVYFSILTESTEFVENPVISTMIYNIEKTNWPEFHNALLRELPEITAQIDNLLETNSSDLSVLTNLTNETNMSNLSKLSNLSKSNTSTNFDMDKAAEILQKYISNAADSAIPYKKSSTFSKR